MNLTKIFHIALFYLSLLAFINPSMAQTNDRVISHDSLIALNEKAFDLVFSNPRKADSLANLALNMALLHKDSLAIARAESVKGSVNWSFAKYNLALKWHFNALGLYELLQDTTGTISTFNNIAEVYKKLEYYENSLRYLHKARSLIRASSNADLVHNSLNTAQVFININANDSASFYLDLAKKEPGNNLSFKMVSFMNYLYARLKQNEEHLDEAIVYIEQSIQFAEQVNNVLFLAEAYLLLGELKVSLGDVEGAKTEFDKVLAIGQKYAYEHIKLEVYKNLYEIAIIQQNTTKALEYLLQYSKIKDNIYNLSVSRQAAEFETVYQLEKMEKENFLLQTKHDNSSNIIKYQVVYIMAAVFALLIALYILLIINKQRKSLKIANNKLEVKSKLVESQKYKLEKQSKNTDALNKELTLLNKNLDSRAQEIAREIEVKNKKMNKYAFMNAHKLRAPIASILGLINLFDKGISESDEEIMIRMLKESADKLDNVVHEIKDVIDQ